MCVNVYVCVCMFMYVCVCFGARAGMRTCVFAHLPVTEYDLFVCCCALLLFLFKRLWAREYL